jgi:2-polyprenyl-3-methyl-5-hydroxy-6-metoxy-1,4-benzoquinol methylase
MTLNAPNDDRIIQSWIANAHPWTIAVREEKIESRRLVTNPAIVAAVMDQQPKTVLDLGCGEGWLARALAANGIAVMGVDVVPALIERAKAAGGGQFEVLSYEEVAAGKLNRKFDVVVSNFALLGQQSVVDLFKQIPTLLTSNGALIIQTLHPVLICSERRYEDGWREEAWAGLASGFSAPAPWYFRTLASWVRLYRDHGLALKDIREPLHPKTGKPVSVVFIGSVAD